ncbi:MAG: hypothetical protein K2X86_08245 [Cytophagaceae bacterium]|nr:hypothetical protein [Cytophagaceae bacterium]
MKSITQIHNEHTEFLSTANSLKKEINFLLKQTNSKLASLTEKQKIKVLEGYYASFDAKADVLDQFIKKVKNEEKQISIFYRRTSPGAARVSFPENENLDKELKDLVAEIKLLKDSLYDALLNEEKSV